MRIFIFILGLVIAAGGFVAMMICHLMAIPYPMIVILWCILGPVIGLVMTAMTSEPMSEPWLHDDY